MGMATTSNAVRPREWLLIILQTKRDRVLEVWLKAQTKQLLRCSTTCTKYKERLIQRSRTKANVGTDPKHYVRKRDLDAGH